MNSSNEVILERDTPGSMVDTIFRSEIVSHCGLASVFKIRVPVLIDTGGRGGILGVRIIGLERSLLHFGTVPLNVGRNADNRVVSTFQSDEIVEVKDLLADWIPAREIAVSYAFANNHHFSLPA